MIRFALVLILAAGLAGLAACGGASNQDTAGSAARQAVDRVGDVAQKAEQHAADVNAAAGGPPVAVPAQTAELGCGMCTYHMAGVQECVAAAKIGEKPYLVKGFPLDAHGLGLCASTKQALVEGEIKDGAFFAAKVDVQAP